MIKNVCFCFLLLLSFIYSQEGYKKLNEEIFFDFENETEVWKIVETKNNIVNNVSISTEKFLSNNKSLKITFTSQGEGLVEKEFFKDLSIYKNIVVNVYIPENISEDLKICFFLQDNEWLWYQTPLFILKKGQWNRILLNVEPSSTIWENIGHSQPWSEKTISSIRKIGIKIFSNIKGEGIIYLDEIKGTFKVFPEVFLNKKKINQFEKLEISFYLPKRYNNPFDPDEINIEAVFIDPDEKIYVIPGFYYQEYERELTNEGEILTPLGYPFWKIRFTPEKVGKYKFFITVKDKDGIIKTEFISFIVENGNRKNKFIKVSDVDKRFFSFKSGEFFYPIGLNIRSPTDERYTFVMRKKPEIDRGTFYYEYIFKKMNENGMNFTEIWMAPWFAALEWKENRPGYKGVGFYNLRNAWKLDKIFELAELYNIFIQLVIINHGQLSTWCDQEWQDNPYNIKNGGFLNSPDEFFVNEKAKKYTKNKLRYIAARWGYSPYLFSWEILNEINLVGASHGFYLKNDIENWYREMADYLRNIDPYNHLITAHYTILVDNKILSEIIDYTITNGYYSFTSTNLPVFFRNIYNYNSYFGKPTFISEYGGTPMASTIENLKRDIILGLWFSFHLPFAATPLFWWHRFVDEFNLFHLYKNFSEYVKEIDRIKMNLEEEKTLIEGYGKNQLYSIGIGNRFFTSVFLYDYSTLRNIEGREFNEFKNTFCILKNKKRGYFFVEFYDPEIGKISEKILKTDEKGDLIIEIPPFKKWISIKVSYYHGEEY